MKYFDTIYKIKPTPVQESNQTTTPTQKTKRSNYFFFKAAEVVLAFWIVTVLAIVTNPWLDYWVKSVIKNKTPTQEVMGQSDHNSIVTSADQPIFYLKNNNVEIKAPIVEGIDETSLTKGIGHHPDSVWPDIKGNVVLAGSNFELDAENPYGQVFRNLRDVNIGDEVQIFFNGKNYIYDIFKREIIKPDDISLFGKTDEFLLTFYTCDPPYTDWKRLVFQAKLSK